MHNNNLSSLYIRINQHIIQHLDRLQCLHFIYAYNLSHWQVFLNHPTMPLWKYKIPLMIKHSNFFCPIRHNHMFSEILYHSQHKFITSLANCLYNDKMANRVQYYASLPFLMKHFNELTILYIQYSICQMSLTLLPVDHLTG